MCHDYAMRDKWVKGLRYALQLDQYLKQKESSNMYPYRLDQCYTWNFAECDSVQFIKGEGNAEINYI